MASELNGSGNGNGAVATTTSGMSTEQLAQSLAKQRQPNAPAGKTSTAGTGGTAGNEGQAGSTATAEDLKKLSDAEQAEAARVAALSPEEREIEATNAAEAERLAGLTEEERAAEIAAAEVAATGDEPNPDDDGEEPLDLTQVPKLTPEQAKHVGEMFRKRIGAAKAKYLGEAEQQVAQERTAREAAESANQQLQAQLDQAQQNAGVQTPGADPMAAVTNPTQLAKAINDAQMVAKWARQNLQRLGRNPEAVAAAIKQAGVELTDTTPEALEEWLTQAQDKAEQTLTVDAPKREKFLAEEAKFNVQADRAFPFLKDPKTPEYADAMGVLAAVPEIKKLPHWRLAVGVYAIGLKTIKAQQAAAAKNAPATAAKPALKSATPTKVATRPGTAARSTTATEAKETEAQQTFQKTGSVDSLAKMFASKRT